MEASSADPQLSDVDITNDSSSIPARSKSYPALQVSNVDQVHQKTGVAGAASNLVNSIVGAGIIGIPFAIDQAGFVAGVVLIIAVSIFTDKSLRMIVELATQHPTLQHLGVRTFEDLMKIPYGSRWGSNFILCSMFVLAYGAMVAYLLIIKDTVPTVLGLGNSFWHREVVMLVVSLCTLLPLSMLRDIGSLAFTSCLSVTADVVLVILVMVFSPVQTTLEAAGGFWEAITIVDSRLFIGLGVLSTAMACQHSAFLIATSLHDTKRQWNTVTCSSLTIAGALSLLLGATGYLGYLDEVQGDVLNNFDGGSRLVNAARGLLAVTMIFTYPMESFVARHCISQWLWGGAMDDDGEASSWWCGNKRVMVTVGLYLAALVPALIFHDLGLVLSLTGSLGASAIAYTAPGLVYLGVNGEEFLDWVGVPIRTAASNEIELPVAGDSKAVMDTTGSNGMSMPSSSRPWWWFPLLMPIWVSIASTGAHGTRAFLSDHQQQPDTTTRFSTKRDFIWSIMFICFGIVAAVCGLASNIFVQVHNIFFSPSR